MVEVRDERGRARDGRGKGGRRKFPDASRVPFSRTVFEVERRGVARVLTECARVTRVKWESGGDDERFSVPSRDAAKVVAICASLCYNYKIIKEKGVVLAFLRASVRAGVVLGLAAVVAAFALRPMLVTGVEFSGDDLPAVREAVSESGVKTWAFLPAFDADELERTLLSLDGVAFASVTKRGTRVYVDVRAERDGEHFVDVPTGEVKAAKTASVTRVVLRSGTAEVSYGDVVRPGDVLIGAYVLSGEERVPCPADGEVFGLVDRTFTRFFPDTELVREEGRVHRETRLSFGGDMPAVPESPFAEYTLEVERSRNTFLIGYDLYTFTFREVRVSERENTLSEDEMERIAASSALESVGALSVVRMDVVSERTEGGTLVRVSVQTEERIDNENIQG